MIFSQPSFSQVAPIKVVNEVLFHIQKKAYTSFDLKQFEIIKSDVISQLDPAQQRILKGLSSYDVFVLYAISQGEAEALDLNIESKDQVKFEQEKKPWKTGFWRANLYLQTKENLFVDRERFNSWFQMLKNKYDYFKKNSSLS